MAGNDGVIAQARAALQAARVELATELRGTQGWNDAMARLQEAKRALSNAELEAARVRDSRRGDISDPVEAARDEVRAAERALRRDRRDDQPQGVINQDIINRQNARLRRSVATDGVRPAWA